MTKESEWGEPLTGPEIKALGLPGDTPVKGIWEVRLLNEWLLANIWQCYRLPAEHPAYIVHRYNKEHGTNFVYWAGGESAPADWDGGDVLWGDGLVVPPKFSAIWTRDYPIDHFDIIGYTKKPQLVTEEASEPLQSAVKLHAPANHGPAADGKGEAGDWRPCERTVRMCIDAVRATPVHIEQQDGVHLAKKRLEALLPKPDRADELVSAWLKEALPHAEGFNGFDEVKEFSRWLIERGEIKG